MADEQKVSLDEIEGMSFGKDNMVRESTTIRLIEDEWYLAKVSDIYGFENEYNGDITQKLKWVYELQDPKFSWTAKDKKYYFRVYGETYQYISPVNKSKNPSTWECTAKIMGLSTDVESFNQFTAGFSSPNQMLKPLIGKLCYIMVREVKGKSDPSKIYYPITKIKHYSDKDSVSVINEKVLGPKPVMKSVKETVKPKVNQDMGRNSTISEEQMEKALNDFTTDPNDLFKDLNIE
jgi:hypothetical protein